MYWVRTRRRALPARAAALYTHPHADAENAVCAHAFVPCFFPFCLRRQVMLFVLTMKRQIKHMIKHRYLPFTRGKQARGVRARAPSVGCRVARAHRVLCVTLCCAALRVRG